MLVKIRDGTSKDNLKENAQTIPMIIKKRKKVKLKTCIRNLFKFSLDY